jgi:hypothetical protein
LRFEPDQTQPSIAYPCAFVLVSWRAVDDEGEVLDLLVQRRRDKAAAVKLMRKLLKKHGFAPTSP